MDDKRILRTTAGDFPLDEYCLRTDNQEWKILHVSTIISGDEESRFLRDMGEILPYGVTLWAAGIALAHELAALDKIFNGKRVLELGSGTGLPGIVAASHGAQVVQTDRNELAMSVGRRNIALNNTATIEQRLADWLQWNDTSPYDWIIGSDVLYAEENHLSLRHIFESNLAPEGKILLSDPFREASISFLETLEADGWEISMSKWNVGEAADARTIGIFELSPPV